MKNITGLWIIQETRRHLAEGNQLYSYEDIVRLAESATPFNALIDPNDLTFLSPGNMPEKIEQFCKATQQPAPSTHAELFRLIYESIALKCRQTIEQITECTGKSYQTIHLIGGGTKASTLCQMIADATNKTVIAGPIEASALGNIAIQLMTLGAIDNLTQARQIIARSTDLVNYHPQSHDTWQQAYQTFQQICQKEAL